jgi:hypothetical protein
MGIKDRTRASIKKITTENSVETIKITAIINKKEEANEEKGLVCDNHP